LTRHPLVIGVERRGFNVAVLDISSHRLDDGEKSRIKRSWLGGLRDQRRTRIEEQQTILGRLKVMLLGSPLGRFERSPKEQRK